MQKIVSDYDALPINSGGMLPNGLQAWKWIALDCYVGTKEILVHAGIAQAGWFPRAATSRRVFTINTTRGRIKLVARSDSEWEVDVPVPEAERQRREKAYRRQVKADRGAQIWEDEVVAEQEDAELRASITLAPPVAPESLTESERCHLRVLRTVGARTRSSILDFTERLLLADARYGELTQRQVPRLWLVVDNSRKAQLCGLIARDQPVPHCGAPEGELGPHDLA